MDFLSKTRQLKVTVKRLGAKVQTYKASESATATQKVVQLWLEAPIGAIVLKALDPRLQSVIRKSGEGEQDLCLKALRLAEKVRAKVTFSGHDDEIVKGAEGSDDPLDVTLTGIAIREGESFLKLSASGRFDKAFWDFCGAALEEDVVMKITPLQKNLPGMDGEEEETEEAPKKRKGREVPPEPVTA